MQVALKLIGFSYVADFVFVFLILGNFKGGKNYITDCKS